MKLEILRGRDERGCDLLMNGENVANICEDAADNLLLTLESLRRENSELLAALLALHKAEDEYGDSNNVAINQAWEAAGRILTRYYGDAYEGE